MFGLPVLLGYLIPLLDMGVKILLIITLLKVLKALDIYIDRN